MKLGHQKATRVALKKLSIFIAIFALLASQFSWAAEAFAEGEDPEPEPATTTGTFSISVSGSELEYSEYSGNSASDFMFGINGSTEAQYSGYSDVNFTRDGEDNITGYSLKEPMEYTYYYDNEDTVTFNIHTQWDDVITSLKINGTAYTTPQTKDALIAAFDKETRAILFDIKDVPYATHYSIIVEGRKQTDTEKIMGNFSWSYQEDGYYLDTNLDQDEMIPHGKIEFVSATYGENTYDSDEAVNEAGNIYEWRDEYCDEESKRCAHGEAMFPVGTELTVKLIPDSGYQLTEFTLNGEPFTAGDEVYVYTFTIQPGNFHLGASFTAVENKVITDEADGISAGTVDSAFTNGTAKLEVSDIDTPSTSSNFVGEAEADGYTIDDYYGISLYNTIYKGNETDSWDTQVDNPTESSTITFKLEDENASTEDIVVIHEIHDGDTVTGYETLDTVYNEDTNSITFTTSSFSNFALASKEKSDTQKHTVTFETNGGTTIDSREVTNGRSFSAPTTPTKSGYVFDGWYSDANLEHEYDFNSAITGDLTLYAKWHQLNKYTVSDIDGNSIRFSVDGEHEYELTIADFGNMPEEVLETIALILGITKEEYIERITNTKEAVKEYGETLAIYGIVLAENNQALHDGPFELRLKMTEAMKGYDTYKLIFIDYDNDYAIEEPIEFTADGDYLEGTLNHLSYYVLTGANDPKAPDTGFATISKIFSSSNIWFSAAIAVAATSLVFISLKRKKLN